MAWDVQLGESAERFILDNVSFETTLGHIEQCCQLLSEFPDVGSPYEPTYPAAVPPFACRSIRVPDTPFTLYYLKDDQRHTVVVFAVEWSAGDPKKRFRSSAW